jgi:hypothetical protein
MGHLKEEGGGWEKKDKLSPPNIYTKPKTNKQKNHTDHCKQRLAK